jgi:hypothetical protein
MLIDVHSRKTDQVQRGRITKQLPGKFMEVTFVDGKVEQLDLERRIWKPVAPAESEIPKAAFSSNCLICEKPGHVKIDCPLLQTTASGPQIRVVDTKHFDSAAKVKANQRAPAAGEQIKQPSAAMRAAPQPEQLAPQPEQLAESVAALFTVHAARTAELVRLKEAAIANEHFMEVTSLGLCWAASNELPSLASRARLMRERLRSE